MIELRQSTAITIPVGPFVDTSGVAVTTLTLTQPDVRLRKFGSSAWAQKNAAQTLPHKENGWYDCDLDVTDTNTLGFMKIAVNETGALQAWQDCMVLTPAAFDAKYTADKFLQSATASTAQLDTGSSAVDDFYNGQTLYIVGGTGAGQSRHIPELAGSYVGLTRTATISPNWKTTPTSGSSFIIIPTSRVAVHTNADKTDYGLSTAAVTAIDAVVPSAIENADALLKRDWTAVTGEATRSVLNALRFLRNKWTVTGSPPTGTLSVKKEDDSTEAWNGATTIAATGQITQIDPT
jgi:hypothetical protein